MMNEVQRNEHPWGILWHISFGCSSQHLWGAGLDTGSLGSKGRLYRGVGVGGFTGMTRRFWEQSADPEASSPPSCPLQSSCTRWSPCPIHHLRVLPELQLVWDGVCSPCRGPSVSPHCPLRVVQPLSTAFRVYCVNPALVCPVEAGSWLAPSDW